MLGAVPLVAFLPELGCGLEFKEAVTNGSFFTVEQREALGMLADVIISTSRPRRAARSSARSRSSSGCLPRSIEIRWRSSPTDRSRGGSRSQTARGLRTTSRRFTPLDRVSETVWWRRIYGGPSASISIRATIVALAARVAAAMLFGESPERPLLTRPRPA